MRQLWVGRRTRLRRIVFGIALIGVSLLALAAPLAVGKWSLQFLSVFPLMVGVSVLYSTITNPQLRTHPTSYAAGALAIAAAIILFLSPALVVNGVMVLLLVFLVIDGGVKLGQAAFGPASGIPRGVPAMNGAAGLLLAFLGWVVWQKLGVNAAIGVAIAGYTAAAGWQTLVSPDSQAEDAGRSEASNAHPDPLLRLGEHEMFGAARKLQSASAAMVGQVEIYWLMVVGVALFATHVGRMRSYDSWLGLISPVVATAGDVAMAVALGPILVLPVRLCWRRLTRPLERRAWQLRFSGQDALMDALPRRFFRAWTDARFSFSASLRNARTSLPSAGALAIRLGLPVALLFVAINPIWGFSWYFNTESWASAF
jgi:hypothetical protein